MTKKLLILALIVSTNIRTVDIATACQTINYVDCLKKQQAIKAAQEAKIVAQQALEQAEYQTALHAAQAEGMGTAAFSKDPTKFQAFINSMKSKAANSTVAKKVSDLAGKVANSTVATTLTSATPTANVVRAGVIAGVGLTGLAATANHLVNQADARQAQEEADRLAVEQAAADKLAAEQKAEADRLAAQKAEADKLAAEQAEANKGYIAQAKDKFASLTASLPSMEDVKTGAAYVFNNPREAAVNNPVKTAVVAGTVLATGAYAVSKIFGKTDKPKTTKKVVIITPQSQPVKPSIEQLQPAKPTIVQLQKKAKNTKELAYLLRIHGYTKVDFNNAKITGLNKGQMNYIRSQL